MAKPELLAHVKFARLARALGSQYVALGVLELLWQTCYQVTSDQVGTADDIAWFIGWPTQDAARLVHELVAAGFLDPDDADTYRVHDLWDHAPQYVRRRFGQKTMSAVSTRTEPVPVQKVQRLTPHDSIAVLTRLGHELQGERFLTEADLKEALKQLAAQHGIPYDGRSIGAALDRLTRSRRPLLVERR